MINVLFVCLGNICRSPMAEAVFKKKIVQNDMEQEISVSSAAIGHWEIGNPPHEGTKKVLKRHTISYEGMVASQIREQDFEYYDFIIGMDENNIRTLSERSSKGNCGKIHLFMSLVDGREEESVPDPYYTGNFEKTYELIDKGTDEWLKYIQNKVVKE